MEVASTVSLSGPEDLSLAYTPGVARVCEAIAQHKALAAMDECVERLRGLIDSLLDVTGLETGRMKFSHHDYDFALVVKKALERHAASFERAGLRLVSVLPARALPGSGDAQRLSRAIDQLLDNARKFTPAGGAAGVRVRQLASGHYELCVADSGPGVPGEKVGRLFEPFYQVDGSPTRSRGGTGVGLAIVRGIARGHGGDVRVASPADEEIAGIRLSGAAFYIVVAPRAPASRA